MVLKVICDCCKRVFPVSECIEIKDYLSTSWFRCSECCLVFGEEARSVSYYLSLFYESVMNGGIQFGEADFNVPRETVFCRSDDFEEIKGDCSEGV